MRVIKPSRIRAYQDAFPKAAPSLGRWLELMETHDWSSIQQLHRVFPNAGAVTVASGRTVTVFNIAGNHYRLIVAVHFNTAIVYVLDFMTHAEYDRQTWKDHL